MRTLAMTCAVAAAFAVTGSAVAQSGNEITVAVEGLRNNDGVVKCGLFNSPAGFPEADKRFKGVEGAPSGGKATCVFTDVPPGTYAVAYFHAEHNEEKLATGAFGVPQGGYGFSRDARGSFG